MMILEGQIGVLKQGGEQVAGVYNWTSRVALNYTVSDNARIYQPVKTMTARSYWMVKPSEGNEYEAELYQVVNNELVVMDSGVVSVDFPDTTTMMRRQDAPVSMKWVGYEC